LRHFSASSPKRMPKRLRPKTAHCSDGAGLEAPRPPRPESLADEFFAAVRNGEIKEAQGLLDRGVDVNVVGADGETALSAVATVNTCPDQVDVLKFLASTGKAKVEQKIRLYDDGTVLLAACSIRSPKISTIRVLVEGCKADAHAVDSLGMTPLMYACERGADRVVEFLLDVGAALDARDREGNTPLMHACKGNSFGVVERLVKAGADADARNTRGQTAADLGGRRVAAFLREEVERGKKRKKGKKQTKTEKKKRKTSFPNPKEMDVSDEESKSKTESGYSDKSSIEKATSSNKPTKKKKKRKKLSKDEEIDLLRRENAELKAKLSRFEALDILVVWDGEDGGPKVRVVAPNDLREDSQRALDFIWENQYPRDSEYNDMRTKAYAAGERRPMARLYRVKPQLTSEEVDAGEPDFDTSQSRFHLPPYY